MKVTSKFTVALIAGVIVVHAGSVAYRVQREMHLFLQDIARNELVLGRALAHAVRATWESGSETAALKFVEEAIERESHVRIRWVWLDAHPGERYAPVASSETLRPLEQRKPVTARLDQPDGEKLFTYIPLDLPSPRRAALEIANPLRDEQGYLVRSIINATLAALVLSSVLALLAWLLGAAMIGRPVRLLVEQSRRIGAGDLSQRLHPSTRDELGELAHEVDAMCDRLQEARDRVAAETQARITAIEQLRHADRLTTVGTLASGVAHELGSPLNVVLGHAQLIAEAVAPDSKPKDSASVIVAQCRRMTQIIRQLLTFARRRDTSPSSTTEVRKVAEETLRMLQPLARKQGVATRINEQSVEAHARITAAELQQVLINLVVNGIQSMPDGGQVELAIHCVDATRPGSDQSAAPHVRLSVRDEGCGLDTETAQRVFEPFFTTKDVGEGTGLGLSVAYGIVEDHGGWIDLQSSVGHGSTFSLFLPAGAA